MPLLAWRYELQLSTYILSVATISTSLIKATELTICCAFKHPQNYNLSLAHSSLNYVEQSSKIINHSSAVGSFTVV